MITPSRRRFLAISAAAFCLPGAGARAATWAGRAMGARVSMRLEGLSAEEAAPIFAAVEAELARLEDIFSLYRTESQISRLNRAGHLSAPAPELLEVLSVASRLHAASAGAFDPTIQPLWAALAEGAAPEAIEAARARTGFEKLAFDSAGIRLAPGAALTLNGVAQGAVTDAIAALLRREGLRHCLVDMGEIAAIGGHADGADWSAGVRGAGGQILRRMRLRDRALATSAPEAMMLDAARGIGHILHPQGAAHRARTIAVSAPDALLADGLSTALCLVDPAAAPALLSQFVGARLEARL